MSTAALITEAEILADVVDPEGADFSREAAQAILGLSFRDSAKARMRQLLDRNNRGVLTSDEQQTLDKYLRVGQFLDLIQAKARLSLKDAPSGS